jgi:hypothetical protein
MKEIKRYRCDPLPDDEGFDYLELVVKFSDIEPVLKENEELKKKLDKAREALRDISSLPPNYNNTIDYKYLLIGRNEIAKSTLKDIE